MRRDISNREQATIVLRHVTNKMEVLEFIGLYQVPAIDSETLAKVARMPFAGVTYLLTSRGGSVMMVRVPCVELSLALRQKFLLRSLGLVTRIATATPSTLLPVMPSKAQS